MNSLRHREQRHPFQLLDTFVWQFCCCAVAVCTVLAVLVPAADSLSSWTSSFASWVSAVGVLSLLGVPGKNAVSLNVFVPLLGGVASSIVLVCCILVMFYPPGAHSLDIQVPGRPRSLLFTPCRYHYASLNTADFVNQRKAVLCMVTQAPGRLQNSG